MTPADPGRVKRSLDAWDPHEGSGVVMLGCGVALGAAAMVALLALVYWLTHR